MLAFARVRAIVSGLITVSASSLLATTALGIWLYLFFARGGFWRLGQFDADRSRPVPLGRWPRVVAIVPARDEAETIGLAVAGLVRQEYPGELVVVVVNDHSRDDTAEVARRTAVECGAEERVTVVAAAELAAGWTGKLWALQNGVERVALDTAEFFWFTDADIVHAPDTLLRLAGRAEHNHLDLASLMVLLRAETFAERLLIPPFLYFFLQLYPPRWIANLEARSAGAAGGCVLLRRAALERMAGLAAIRGEVIDDCALARAVKNEDGKIWMGVTRRSVSLRAYETFGEIQDMIARTAFTQLRYSALLLAGTLAGLFLTYFAPVGLLFVHDATARTLGGVAWLLMVVSFLPIVKFYRLSGLWAAALPAVAMFYAWATWVSAWRYWWGRGGQWKGRVQAGRVK
ncbi:MAG TPA: glycosyltransferase [Candidatus Saccharimonadales bacterium]|nr:glycosyltransferase [Candidatus Saccharimonadales bacterium]